MTAYVRFPRALAGLPCSVDYILYRFFIHLIPSLLHWSVLIDGKHCSDVIVQP